MSLFSLKTSSRTFFTREASKKSEKREKEERSFFALASFPSALSFKCSTIQKSSSRFRRSRCTQKMIIFPNGVFSFRVLPLERTFSNTRVIISKLGGVYEDIRKSPNMFARRLRIPAARGPLFEYLLMQRARVLKISTLKASEKEKHIILKIYHKLQRDI